MSWHQLPLTVLPAGLPLEDSGDALGHAGPHDLASLFLLLPAGDLRATGLLPVSRTYLGLSHGPAVGVQGMVGNTSSFLQWQQNQPAIVMVTVEERPSPVSLFCAKLFPPFAAVFASSNCQSFPLQVSIAKIVFSLYTHPLYGAMMASHVDDGAV